MPGVKEEDGVPKSVLLYMELMREDQVTLTCVV